ncbi:MAG: Hpt domain-containing protein [Bacteroidetes bacterium]|nr:Hpt domain-containing protein [Bacteroidota bacterium]
MIDWQQFNDYYSAFPKDVVKEIIGDFLSQLPGRLQHIHEAHTDVNWQGIKKEIHQLKGSASFFFDPTLNECFFRMEDAISNRDVAKLNQEYAAFLQSIHLLESALKDHSEIIIC